MAYKDPDKQREANRAQEGRIMLVGMLIGVIGGLGMLVIPYMVLRWFNG